MSRSRPHHRLAGRARTPISRRSDDRSPAARRPGPRGVGRRRRHRSGLGPGAREPGPPDHPVHPARARRLPARTARSVRRRGAGRRRADRRCCRSSPPGRPGAGSLAGTVAGAAAWWAALAQLDRHGFTKGLEWGEQWAPQLAVASRDPGRFLRTFVQDAADLHDPGARPPAGAPRSGWWASTGSAWPVRASWPRLICSWGCRPSSPCSARSGSSWTRPRPAGSRPFLALAPAAVWLVMSFDTLYAARHRLAGLPAPRRHDLDRAPLDRPVDRRRRAGGGGCAAVLRHRAHRVRPAARRHPLPALAPAARGRCHRVPLVLALVPFGFSWFAGLAATRHAYDTLGLDRPYDYFFVNNLAAWALALGPAVVVGLVLLRDRRRLGAGRRRRWPRSRSPTCRGCPKARSSGSGCRSPSGSSSPPPRSTRGRSVQRAFLALQAGTALALVALIETYW